VVTPVSSDHTNPSNAAASDQVPDVNAQRIAAVWRALEAVPDPEIPPVSIVELGMIADVRIDGGAVVVDMTPTFAGCPALDLIREDIRKAAAATASDFKDAGTSEVKVNVVFDPPWTTDRITDEGRRKLKAFGLAPPGARCSGGGMPNLEKTACPYCDSTNTEVESIFGPTLCRSIHYCHACLQSFEHFKAV